MYLLFLILMATPIQEPAQGAKFKVTSVSSSTSGQPNAEFDRIEELPPSQIIVRFEVISSSSKASLAPKELFKTLAEVRNRPAGLGELKPLHPRLLGTELRAGKRGSRLDQARSEQLSRLLATALVSVDGDSEHMAGMLMKDQPFLEQGIKITAAFPNRIYKTSQLPDDPLFSEQWYLQNTGQYQGQAGVDVGALDAWTTNKGEGAIIAIIDSGVDWQHEDLRDNIWINPGEIADNGIDDDGNGFIDDIRGWDFVDLGGTYCFENEDCFDEDNDPMDVNGHGTHCAGIAAAAQNQLGISGIAPQARIMPVRAGFHTPLGGALHTSFIIQALTYATLNGADIISMSFGNTWSNDLQPELEFAVSMGAIPIAASGNFGSTLPSYPAASPSVISVGAIDYNNERAFFSNYGTLVDIMAPGLSIMSTWPGNNYQTASGTSMACPLVAGMVALTRKDNPNWTVGDVRAVLQNNSVDMGRPDWDEQTTFGRAYAPSLIQGQAPSPGTANILPFFEEVGGLKDIMGTASSQQLSRYALSYRPQAESSWTELCDNGTEVIDGVLCSIDLSNLPQGINFMRLDVYDTNNRKITAVTKLDTENIKMDFPLNQDQYDASIPLVFPVQVLFEYDEVEVFTKPSGRLDWTEDHISYVEIPGGIQVTWQPVFEGRQGRFDLELRFKKGETTIARQAQEVLFNHHYKQGWPKRMPCYRVPEDNVIYSLGDLTPNFYDLDRDGNKEMLIMKNTKQPAMDVYNMDGSLRWSVNMGELNGGGQARNTPVVFDANGKGDISILTFNMFSPNGHLKTQIILLDADGNPKEGFPMDIDRALSPEFCVADLDGDGVKEIIILRENTNTPGVTVLNYRGEILSEWNLGQSTTTLSSYSSPSVGQFDDDPELEIVFNHLESLEGDTYLYVVDMDGTPLPGWPIALPGLSFNHMIVADIDADGREDVVVNLEKSSSNQGGGLYVFDRNGSPLPGWPIMQGNHISYTPALGDINGDGFLDLAFFASGSLFVADHRGNIHPGFPASAALSSKILMADVTADGFPELIAAVKNGDDQLEVGFWDHKGRWLYELTQSTEGIRVGFPSIPAIVDLDEDGILELVYTTNFDHDTIHEEPKCTATVHVWELPGSKGSNELPWPTLWRDPARTCRFEQPNPIDLQNHIQIPHAPSNAIWNTELAIANCGPMALPVLAKGKGEDGSITVKRQLDLLPQQMVQDSVAQILDPRLDHELSRFTLDSPSQSRDLLTWQRVHTLGNSLSSGFALSGDNLLEVANLDHIPREPWWLGLAMANGSKTAIDLYFSWDGGIIRLDETYTPRQPGDKVAFLFKDIWLEGERPLYGRLLAYEEGSFLDESGFIIGTPTAALLNPYVLFGPWGATGFSEGFYLNDSPGYAQLWMPLGTSLRSGATSGLNRNDWDGLSLINTWIDSIEVTATVVAADGSPQFSHTKEMVVGEKWTFTPEQFGLVRSPGSYLNITADQEALRGLFLAGDEEGPRALLAGAAMVGQPRSTLFAPVRNGAEEGSFLNLINTSNEAVIVSFEVTDQNGELADSWDEAVDPRGMLELQADRWGPDFKGLIKASSSQGMVGYLTRYGKTDQADEAWITTQPMQGTVEEDLH